MFQANLFGHMHVTKAILPYFRAQGHGRIGFTSSSTAWAPLPFMSHYAASKAALSSYVEALHKEVRSLGIQCVAFECGGFPTHLGRPREASQAAFGSTGPAVASYGPLFGELVGMFAADPMAYMPGDLAKAATAIVDVITRKDVAARQPWAVRIALGSDGMASVKQKCEEQLKLVDGWKDISCSTDRDSQGYLVSKEMLKFTSILETEV
jgi:short-subunit dehydrogenase